MQIMTTRTIIRQHKTHFKLLVAGLLRGVVAIQLYKTENVRFVLVKIKPTQHSLSYLRSKLKFNLCLTSMVKTKVK
jgi:hypothetical protein